METLAATSPPLDSPGAETISWMRVSIDPECHDPYVISISCFTLWNGSRHFHPQIETLERAFQWEKADGFGGAAKLLPICWLPRALLWDLNGFERFEHVIMLYIYHTDTHTYIPWNSYYQNMLVVCVGTILFGRFFENQAFHKKHIRTWWKLGDMRWT
jgi:hypothetical protein